MSLLKRLTLLLSTFALVFTVAGGVLAPIQVSYAQADELEEVGDLSGLQDESLQIIVARLIRTFLSVLGIIAVIIVLYGGFVWMTAGGDPDKVDKAKKILINAVIGLAIILLSWSITTFVLNSLIDATGGSSSSSSSSSGSGGSGTYGGGSLTSFAVSSYSPEGEISIRNVVLRVTFSLLLEESTVEGNIVITNTETGEEIAGTLDISGNRISFTPSTPCPEPNEDRFCFDEDTQHTVTISEDIESTSLVSLDCTVSECTSTFTTGDLIDVDDPVVSITFPDSGESISADSSSLVQVSVTDDSEVSTADFYAGDDWFDTVAASGEDLSDVTIESTWYTDETEEGTRYTLEVLATDIAGNEDTDSVRVSILPAHCFSLVMDGDEEGIDCGGSCGACDGSTCTEDIECSSGTCDESVCLTYPEIESVSPSNGAVGTYVTISGSGFGATGHVYFSDGLGGLVEADIPACGDGWGSEEVIVEVPEGADDGPITIETSRGYTDSTDDDQGSLISDFDVNDTQRPNLCNITPNTAEVGDGVTLIGFNFGASQDDSFVYFDTTDASSYSSWSDTYLSVTVPSLTAGEYVDISVTVDGVTSNLISFGVDYSDLDIPTIYSIDPDDGGIGQYVTISGTNFGTSIGSVWFEDQVGGYVAQGSIAFPDACADDIWDDDEITIIVPEEFTTGDALTLGDYNIYVTSQADIDSETIDFEVTDADPTPGICLIDPDVGEVGDVAVIYGERLGSDTGSVEFFSGVSASIDTDGWDDESVTVTVPFGTQTGALTATSAAGDQSNELNFEVGTEADVTAAVVQGGYSWYFSTGDIPDVPRLLVECSETLISAVPNIRFTGEACTNSVVRGTFSTLIDTGTISSDTIQVYECEDFDCDLSTDERVDAEVLADSIESSSSTTQTWFTWRVDSDYNGGNFETSTTYLVEVSDEITAYSETGIGETMEADVSWKFTTGPDEADCYVEEVMVSPTSATIDEEGDTSEFDALPLVDCQVLDPIDYDWDWNTDTGSYIGVTVIADSYRVSAVGHAEGVTTLTAEETESGTEGESIVTVNFADPYVSYYQPDCTTACINGDVGMTFNVVMDSSITGDVTLYSCSNELCSMLTEIDTIASCSDISTISCSEVTLTISDSDYGTSLREAEFYRVIVSGSAISNSGVPLTRTNYGDDFSWTFGTKDDDGLCLVSSISLLPENAVLESIGETQYYEVSAYGSPDSCSVAGQALSGYNYDWEWTDPIIDDEDVAEWVTISSGLFDVGQANIPDGCTSACLASGSETYYGICGNGITETGEDENCDGEEWCSSSCLNEGTDSCTYSCSSTSESCSTDLECQEVCTDIDPDTLEGLCSISGIVCSEDINCTYVSSTCNQDAASCCGDGDLDDGEECDDGGTSDRDGCSASCLNEGSQMVGATCGNGDVAHDDIQGGEDCDDGNASSGDGCSSICLNEGTPAITEVSAECGDGTIDEPDETCDDSNLIDGDGCSSTCIREGADADYASFGSAGECGDGGLDQNSTTGAGEDCDGGEWCSSDCLLSGSSIYYVDPSVCGDGIVGSGELDACEESDYGAGRDGLVDPVQLAKISTDAAEQVDMETNLATTTVEVTYNDSITSTSLTAYTSLYLSCVAEYDNDCDRDEGFGPATTGCCMVRPDPDLFPNGSNACLNAQIYGLFDMRMDTSTFEDNVTVTLDVSTTDSGLCPSTHTTVAMNTISKKWWQKVFDIFSMIVAPRVHAQISGDCILPLTGFTQNSLEDGVYQVIFNHDDILEADAEYTILVIGDELDDVENDRNGVLTTYGVAMDGDSSQTFETYQSICGLDEVIVLDEDQTNPDVFTQQGEEHTFVASAYSYDTGSAQAIESVTSYAWGWTSWISVDVGQQDEDEDEDEDEESEVTSSTIITFESETVGIVDHAEVTYSATGTNGEANITTTAIITEDTSGDSFYCNNDASITGCTSETEDIDCGEGGSCEAASVIGVSGVTTFLCENPWPSIDYFPFDDSIDGIHPGVPTSTYLGRAWLNFSTYYCRDDGDEDSFDDDYPELRVVMAQEQGTDSVLKEYFFNVYDNGFATGDAIGIRAVKNESYLSPLAWYNANGFSGSPSETTIDGFQAVVDGRSTYVAMPNYASGAIYPNIIIISYNYGASSTTVEIYDMLLDYMSFVNNVEDTELCYSSSGESSGVSCSSDLDCDQGYTCASVKLKLMRDMQRLGDITDISADIGSTTPQIESGSFVRSLSSSIWGSWSDVLATSLGVSIASDPLNEYIRCGLGSYSDYDSETCVNETTGEYICPLGSRTYHYRAYGDSGYVLGAELEYKEGRWIPDIDRDMTDDEQIIIGGHGPGDGFQSTGAFCDGTTIWGSSDICGDGVVGSGELCEVGDTISSSTACDSDEDGVDDGYYVEECSLTCDSYEETTTCSPISCGNGVIEGTEECDDGSLNGSYGFCGADCSNSDRTYCGDGSLAGGEACDCSSVSPAAGAAFGGGACSYLNGVYSTDASDTCAWDCSGPGPYCGNGDVDDAEACDGDTDTYSGKICSTTTIFPGEECTQDSDCGVISSSTFTSSPESAVYRGCGEEDPDDDSKETANDCPLTTVCVDGDASKSGEPCDVNSDCSSTSESDGVCSTFEYQTTRTRSCNDTCSDWAEDWSAIDCIAPGSCGDGVVDDGEECDDGNDDSSDSCTVECTSNVCGDGYIYGGEESCDEGGDNGVMCESSYGSTCAYCNDNCISVTSSGSFCGDGVINGDEVCDADDIPYHYYNITEGLGGTCDASAVDTSTTVEGVDYICKQIGVCNGGAFNGENCRYGDFDCGSSGTCVLPSCEDSCTSMCPFTYDAQSIAIKTNELGASRSYSADLSPFDAGRAVLSTGNSSTLYIPACTTSDALSMTIDDDYREYPDVEIMFVLDKSNSMDWSLGSCVDGDADLVGESCDVDSDCDSSVGGDGSCSVSDRITVLSEVVATAVTSFYEAYDTTSASMSIGWAYISGVHDLADTKSFLSLAPTTDEETLQIDLINNLVTDDENGTPIYQSIEDARDAFTGTADVEYMIIFTDGNIQNTDYEDLDSSTMDTTAADSDGSAIPSGTVFYCSDGTRVLDLDDCGDSSSESEWTSCGCGVMVQDEDDCVDVCDYERFITFKDDSIKYVLENIWSQITHIFEPPIAWAIDSIEEEEYMVAVSNLIDEIKADGVYIYSAALTDNTCDIQQMARWSSMECDAMDESESSCVDQRAEGNYLCLNPEDGITYAYDTTSAAGLAEMYEEIVSSILNVTISTTFDGETESTNVEAGLSKTIALPSTFLCDDSGEQTVTLRTTFSGGGTIELRDINLNMCAE